MTSRSDPISPALEATLSRCAEMVRRIGTRHGMSEADVDEVFQEVRIRLWRALAGSEKIAQARASYVYRTATSAALDLIRRRRVRREEELDVSRDASGVLQTAQPGADVMAETTELCDIVAETVDELIESRRPVVQMSLNGYRLEEIADLLGWSEAKTRNLLYRGLTDLRTRLCEKGIGPEALG